MEVAELKASPSSLHSVYSTMDDMTSACQTCVDTVSDFLAYDKLSSNLLCADKSVCDMYHLIVKAARPFMTQAKLANVEFACYKDQNAEAIIDADEYKLNQVLRNLLSNAVKFSSPGMTVSVHVSHISDEVSGTDWVRVGVADEGPGISLENQERLFHEVAQFHPGKLQGGGGSGYGLWYITTLLRYEYVWK
jgi:two-component system sensor histidine kinase/response regulator